MYRIVKWFCCIIMMVFLALNGIVVLAQQIEDDQTEQEILNQSGAAQLLDKLPQETARFFEQNGIEKVDSSEILNLDGKRFFEMLWDGILAGMSTPIRILATIVGMIMLSALLGTFEHGFADKSFSKVFHVLSVLCISGIIVTPVISLIEETVELIKQVSSFLMGFIPIFTGIISVSGKPLSAFAYHGMLLGCVELVSVVAANLLIPLCGIYLALCLTSAATDQVEVGGISKSIQTIVKWILGFLLTLFVGILTVKSFVANSADTITLKTGKYFIGSLVPMVGSAISETLSVIQGSVNVIQSTVGAFGILAIVICFLPGIIHILLMNFAIRIAQGVGDMLHTQRISGLLQATSFVLSFLQSLLICYGIMVIISISLMLVLGLSTT